MTRIGSRSVSPLIVALVLLGAAPSFAQTSSQVTTTSACRSLTGTEQVADHCALPGGIADSYAHASANFGALKVDGSTSVVVPVGPFRQLAFGGYGEARASFADRLTLSGQPSGTTAYLTYGVDVQGTTTSQLDNPFNGVGIPGFAQSQEVWQLRAVVANQGNIFDHERVAFLQVPSNTSQLSFELLNNVSVSDLTGIRYFTVPVTFGSAFDISFALLAYAVANVQYVPPEGSADAFSAFDLGHSVYWGGVTSVTVDGVEVPYSLTSASGQDYARSFAPAVVAVPEPSTWLLLLMGGGLISFMARRRSARQGE